MRQGRHLCVLPHPNLRCCDQTSLAAVGAHAASATAGTATARQAHCHSQMTGFPVTCACFKYAAAPARSDPHATLIAYFREWPRATHFSGPDAHLYEHRPCPAAPAL